VTLANTSAGGQLRGTVVCDTGGDLRLSPLPDIAASGASSTLVSFNPAGCLAPVLVVTNQSQTAPNPRSSASRSFSISTATAPSATPTLSVRIGSGNGTVMSSPAGIDCGTDCSQTYTEGTSVTLTATPAPGSSFAGWSGPCSGTGQCTISMDQSRSAGAAFSLVGAPETTLTDGPGGMGQDDRVAPAISRLRLSPAIFRAARSGPALAALVGTRVSLTLPRRRR